MSAKTRIPLTRKLFATATAALALLTATGTTPAQAATPRNGICETGEVCFYYNSNFAGSVSDFTTSIPNYGTNPATCYVFQGPGNGQGKCIKNEVASVVNKSNQPVTVYYNSNYAGATQVIPAGQSANLNPTLKNNNASHRFGQAATPPINSPVSFGTPGVNPHPAATTKAPNATARTQFVDDAIANYTGMNKCWVGGYRNYERSTSNHNTGNALDCTISDGIGKYPSEVQKAYGWRIANWLKAHAVRLQVRYVIWNGKIWSVARSAEGWRNYSGSGPTNGHHDHIHVSIQNPYGD